MKSKAISTQSKSISKQSKSLSRKRVLNQKKPSSKIKNSSKAEDIFDKKIGDFKNDEIISVKTPQVAKSRFYDIGQLDKSIFKNALKE